MDWFQLFEYHLLLENPVSKKCEHPVGEKFSDRVSEGGKHWENLSEVPVSPTM